MSAADVLKMIKDKGVKFLGADDTVYSIDLMSDGDILLGGNFTMVNGLVRRGVARLFGDGILNPGPPEFTHISRTPSWVDLQLSVRTGRSYVLEIENDSAWHHPFHLHGVAFRALSEPHQPWRDTALIAPGARAEFAFVADNPGDWMIHCQILEHQEAGMMAVMRIE